MKTNLVLFTVMIVMGYLTLIYKGNPKDSHSHTRLPELTTEKLTEIIAKQCTVTIIDNKVLVWGWNPYDHEEFDLWLNLSDTTQHGIISFFNNKNN